MVKLVKEDDKKTDTFRLDHKEVVSRNPEGWSLMEIFDRAENLVIEQGVSGPHGPGVDDEYGEDWAFSRRELPR